MWRCECDSFSGTLTREHALRSGRDSGLLSGPGLSTSINTLSPEYESNTAIHCQGYSSLSLKLFRSLFDSTSGSLAVFIKTI